MTLMPQKWTPQITNNCRKQLRKLDKHDAAMILAYMQKRILVLEDPTVFAKPMIDDFSGYWRYRIGNHRLIVDIIDDTFTIIAIEVGHRRLIYQ